MRRSVWWFIGFLLIGCSGGDDGRDDDIRPSGPGTLTVDAYPSTTNLASITVSGTKNAGAGVEVDGTATVMPDPSTTFEVTLSLNDGPNTFSLTPYVGTAKGPPVTVSIKDRSDQPPVSGSDAVFAATAALAWRRSGFASRFPLGVGATAQFNSA